MESGCSCRAIRIDRKNLETLLLAAKKALGGVVDGHAEIGPSPTAAAALGAERVAILGVRLIVLRN